MGSIGDERLHRKCQTSRADSVQATAAAYDSTDWRGGQAVGAAVDSSRTLMTRLSHSAIHGRITSTPSDTRCPVITMRLRADAESRLRTFSAGVSPDHQVVDEHQAVAYLCYRHDNPLLYGYFRLTSGSV